MEPTMAAVVIVLLCAETTSAGSHYSRGTTFFVAPASDYRPFYRTNVNHKVPQSTAAPERSHPDPISTHILDTGAGMPAAGVEVRLFRMQAGSLFSSSGPQWTKINSKITNSDGRASGFLSWESFQPGTYKIFFNTGAYFDKAATQSFYPFAEVVFEIVDATAHYHVPLLLSPYAYSTYRGS